MINSLVIDFLIRIKNGYKAGRKSIDAPASKFCIAVAELLKKQGFITDYSISGDTKKTLTVKLSYQDDKPKINQVEIFSKPGRRYYEKNSSLPWGKTNESLIIISTSSGLLTQKEAAKKGVGGEIIAQIY